MNRIIKFKKYGGPEVLEIETEEKVRQLAKGEVLVKMSAYALNRSNVLFRQGEYIYPAEFPSRLGSEAVGVVEKISEDVSSVKVGDRVSLLAPENESKQGYLADYNIVSEANILPVAKALTDYQASTAWIPYLTVYKNIVENENVKEGSWVILPAASSSVSLAANQVAKYLGAKTIGITRTSKKVVELKNLGFDEVIISNDENVEERIKEITGGGANFAFDPVGGESLTPLINSLKHGSDLVIYGVLSGQLTELPIFPLMETQVRISCYSVYELLTDTQRFKEALEYFLPLFEKKVLAPTHDENIFDLSDIVAGFEYLESNQQLGKVIIKSN